MDTPKRLLLPTDFSETSAYAFDYALSLASKLGAKVDVLHIHPLAVVPEGVTLTVDVLPYIISAAEDSLELFVGPRHSSPALGAILLKGGDAPDLILETADERRSDMIVMGSHGKRGPLRAVFGSVTARVLRAATCPVLTIRPKTQSAQTSESTEGARPAVQPHAHH